MPTSPVAVHTLTHHTHVNPSAIQPRAVRAAVGRPSGPCRTT